MYFEFEFEDILRCWRFLNILKTTINASIDIIIEKKTERIAFFINLFNHKNIINIIANDIINESMIMANVEFFIIKLLSF